MTESVRTTICRQHIIIIRKALIYTLKNYKKLDKEERDDIKHLLEYSFKLDEGRYVDNV